MAELATWALLLVRDLECLPGFPRTESGLKAYGAQLQAIAGDKDTAVKLIKLVLTGAERFPTPIELRHIMSAYIAKPADGIEGREADLSDHMSGGGRFGR